MGATLTAGRHVSGLPAAILLDLDNTLYAYDPAHKAGMHAVRRKAADVLGLTAARFDRVYGEGRKAVKAQLGPVAASHSRLLYFQRMLETLGMKSQPLMALDFEQTYWRAYLLAMRLHKDAENFLAAAKELGIRLGVVTNLTAQIQFRKLVHLGLDQYLDIVVTSEEAGANKPDAAPFLLARERLRLAAGEPVWMIGDDAEMDLGGARRHLGARTFLLNTGGLGGAPREIVDVEFRGFRELMDMLGKVTDRAAPAEAAKPLVDH